ncbi:FGGY-family carbohydrate kinase [Aureimonas pseudogalii]|uniref:Sugar (Pentulose or hexulose) kinase n=1 Tax=Aureimonas pseudogalii TaxID=1744844 RepID=A0A7W6EB21_9HYPH|nr:FGGY-family carbohydrate kinase [Aureimonas pseudogalii]MBB3998048.1 sugar (pentulose or hexulose) kinase [Aureimonas pseudogalii]
MPRLVAVVDIGKTNAKVAIHDLVGQRDVAHRSTPNDVSNDGPYPHFDTDRLFRFVCDSLRDLGRDHPIDAIAITTHGASAALVGDDDLALPMLDYEHDLSGPETEAYERLRPPFAETLSPRMANGLNLGNQIYWLQERFPAEFARVRHIMTYPQYWARRLTGVAAFEPTSLGCHTDLWAPERGDFSMLVDAQGWRALFAPRRSAFDVLGSLKDSVARETGLDARGLIPVSCGIHDSNASLLPHLLAMPAPFTVVSTGTWAVSFAIGGRTAGLDAAQGTLANVDAFGRPVPSGLFMGGREFDLLTDRAPATPGEADIAHVVESGAMALPSFAPGSGPFPSGAGRWTVAPETLTAPERTVVASLYTALMTDTVLGLVGADGPTIVEGPFARNALYGRALAILTGRPVTPALGGTGTSAGAALLALGPPGASPLSRSTMAPASAAPVIYGLAAYARRWRALAAQGAAPVAEVAS